MQSFGGDIDQHKGIGMFDQTSTPAFSTLPKDGQGPCHKRLGSKRLGSTACILQPSRSYTEQLVEDMKDSAKPGSLSRDQEGLVDKATVDPIDLFCETFLVTMKECLKNFQEIVERVSDRRQLLLQTPSQEYLSMKRSKFSGHRGKDF